MKVTTKLWIGLAILIILSPIGLILPEHFKAGSAWGEWGADEMQKLAGYIPQGLEKLAGLWNAPIPDYAFKGWEEKGLLRLSFAYIISAIIGIGITAALIMLIGRILAKPFDPSTKAQGLVLSEVEGRSASRD
ncbi:MAG: PDGLE domain-containing protein [Candidatus Omnitrophica bacterium]|nr:PDGLE domain-containing protein [Candidatus Omnitrophota bacterium]